MPVGNLGPDEVRTVSPDDEIREAVEIFESENVGAVVVAEDEEPVGVATDRDVAMAVDEFDDVASEPVESVMTEDPVTLSEDEEAMELSRVMGEENIRRVPIVDDDGQLTGFVSMDDLVATIGEQLDNIADTVEVQSPDYSP